MYLYELKEAPNLLLNIMKTLRFQLSQNVGKNTNIIIDTNGHYDLHLDSLKGSLSKIIDYQLLENKYDLLMPKNIYYLK